MTKENSKKILDKIDKLWRKAELELHILDNALYDVDDMVYTIKENK